eukprot:10146283-Lingulodinium_polyedra.AAC.1
MYYRRSSKGLGSCKLIDLYPITNDWNFGALVELDDSCDDREWLHTEPVASYLSGPWVHSIHLWPSVASVKTVHLARKIERVHMAATSKQTLCHGFASSTSGCSRDSATCARV